MSLWREYLPTAGTGPVPVDGTVRAVSADRPDDAVRPHDPDEMLRPEHAAPLEHAAWAEDADCMPACLSLARLHARAAGSVDPPTRQGEPHGKPMT